VGSSAAGRGEARRRRGPEIYEHRSGSQDLKRGCTAAGPTRCSHSYLHLLLVRSGGQGPVSHSGLAGRWSAPPGACIAFQPPISRLRLRVIRLRGRPAHAPGQQARSPARSISPSPRGRGKCLPLVLLRPLPPPRLATPPADRRIASLSALTCGMGFFAVNHRFKLARHQG
jgi:hypothetical protein